MKKTVTGLLILITTSLLVHADTSLTGYGTYWDGDDSGAGVGLRLKKTFLGFGAADIRGGYVAFDNNTDVVPLEASINLRLPFMISPYAGVGGGYYITSSDLPGMDNVSGYFGQVGVELTIIWIGAMAELRWHDLEGSYLDGTSANVGLLIKW